MPFGFPLSFDESSLKRRDPRSLTDLTRIIGGSSICRVRCLFHYGLLARYFRFRRTLLQLLDLILPRVTSETIIDSRNRGAVPVF